MKELHTYCTKYNTSIICEWKIVLAFTNITKLDFWFKFYLHIVCDSFTKKLSFSKILNLSVFTTCLSVFLLSPSARTGLQFRFSLSSFMVSHSGKHIKSEINKTKVFNKFSWQILVSIRDLINLNANHLTELNKKYILAICFKITLITKLVVRFVCLHCR